MHERDERLPRPAQFSSVTISRLCTRFANRTRRPWQRDAECAQALARDRGLVFL